MYIVCFADFSIGSNPRAIYDECKRRNLDVGIIADQIIAHNGVIDISITNNARSLHEYKGTLSINTGHGNFFLGDTAPEPTIDVYFVKSESEKQMLIGNGYKPENVFVTGSPRSDALFNAPKNAKELVKTNSGLDATKKLVTYAPTYDRSAFGVGRKGFYSQWTTKEDEIDASKALMQAVNNINGELLIRVHRYYKKYWPKILPSHLTPYMQGAMLQSNDTSPDSLMPLLASDILITDFSSIITDAIGIDLPIIFIEPHLNWLYTEKWHAPKDIRYEIGPVVKTPQELKYYVETSPKWHEEIYQPKRQAIKDKYIPLFDGQCSKRAVDTALQIWEERYAGK